MKTLFLVRHSQSSWDDVKLDDRDRPLTDKGKQDASRMGKRLAENEIVVDAILSSPAKRALTTTLAIARKIDFKRRAIIQDERLYRGEVEELLKVIQEVGGKHKRIMLVGHNPVLSELVLHLADKDINLPTCAVATLSFDTRSWAKIGKKKLDKLVVKYA